MEERKAIHYGKVELIPGIICDGYILDDGTAVMSERGTADLLDVDQKLLNRMRTNWPPKSLKSFIDDGLSMRTNLVKVQAKNSPYKNRKIITYGSLIIENIIRGYVLALANHKLRKNQRHIGDRCAILLTVLVRTALESAIKEACGFVPDIQKTAQKNYLNATKLIKKFGFNYSINDNIAIKKDIVTFLKIPESTLNNFLRKHSDDIKPIQIDYATIHSLGIKARRLNGYQEEDVVKIAFGMDTEIGIKLKKRMFGQLGTFIKPEIKEEIQWREVLAKVFQGFDLRYNHPIGKYRVDFFVPTMGLCLECNGYDCHKYYNQQQEEKREKEILQKYSLVRFHHKISLETLFNGILQAKKGKVLKLYDIEDICDKLHLSLN